MSRRATIVAWLALLLSASLAAAAEIRGTVTGLDGRSVIITLDSELRPDIGDRVEISFKTVDDQIPVGIWEVSKVEGATVTAVPVETAAEATIDMVAVIFSQAPRRTAPPPVPESERGSQSPDVGREAEGSAPTSPDGLVGKVFEGEFPIAGWEDMGGGLLADPVWFSHYKRADGAFLVLSLWALPRRPGSQHATFQVVDTLLLPRPERGLELSFDCRQARSDVIRKIIALVRPDPQQQSEWWRDVRQAWEVTLDSGRISPIPPTGVECVNEGWGT